MNLETATVLKSCIVPDVDNLLADFEMHQSLEDQKVAVVRALVCCRDHWSFGLKITLRYLYEDTRGMMLDVTELSGLGLSRLRPPEMGSLNDLEKFISAVFDSSNKEL